MDIDFIIGLLILVLALLTYDVVRTRRNKLDLKKANEDLNIEFSAMEGSGITQVRKNYPDLELKDDKRTGLVDANKS